MEFNNVVKELGNNEIKTVRNYKDTVFCMLYKDKKKLLSLYNAINQTNYENENDLEITTLGNAVYMSMKNDVSCVLDFRMNLYEHQSTVNPNVPLRDLFYVARLYEKYIRGRDIYSRKRIMLPTPKFITFYNGVEKQPETRIMKLSDSFVVDAGTSGLELVVTQININPGYHDALKKACPSLQEYIQYVEKVRNYSRRMVLSQAVEQAVRECIDEDILKDFLIQNRAEVIQMSIFEFDEELHNKTLFEEGREDGCCAFAVSSIIGFLNDIAPVSDSLKNRIESIDDLDVLTRLNKKAARVQSIEEFEELLGRLQ